LESRGRFEGKLRVGLISFVNMMPISLSLPSSGEMWEILEGPPSTVNQLLRSGRVDLAIASSIEYLRDPDSYWILRGVGLGAQGRVGSVLLMSQLPMEHWNRGPIECPRESETSVALLQILLFNYWGIRASLGEEGRERNPVARLRIGDRALEEASSGRWKFVWDLGEAWSRWTGLPFVFALWLARKEALEKKADLLMEAQRVLAQAAERAPERLELSAEKAAKKMESSPVDFIQYFRNLHYSLGEAHWKGFLRFASELLAQGAISHVPPLRFWPP
jgi:chorismate dehydratase